jgi:hypothetical protein
MVSALVEFAAVTRIRLNSTNSCFIDYRVDFSSSGASSLPEFLGWFKMDADEV